MNRLFKNVNTFGLIGVLLAGGLVFTQSAFKPAKSSTSVELIYGYDYSAQGNPWTAYDPENGYECNNSGAQPCKFVFSTPPSPETLPGDSTPAEDAGIGSYQN